SQDGGAIALVRRPEIVLQVDAVEAREVERAPVHPLFRVCAATRSLRAQIAETVLHAQIAHHCTRLPKGPAVLLLEGRQPAVRVLAAVLRIVVATELAAPVDALVRDPELADAPHRFDDVGAVRSSPYLQHGVVP